jgi:hypothetical protein
MLASNDSWRSPDGHLKDEVNKPTDIFSFGIGIVVSSLDPIEKIVTEWPCQCICAMPGRVIFSPDDDFKHCQTQEALPSFIRLLRQVTYFGDSVGIDCFL